MSSGDLFLLVGVLLLAVGLVLFLPTKPQSAEADRFEGH